MKRCYVGRWHCAWVLKDGCAYISTRHIWCVYAGVYGDGGDMPGDQTLQVQRLMHDYIDM